MDSFVCILFTQKLKAAQIDRHSSDDEKIEINEKQNTNNGGKIHVKKRFISVFWVCVTMMLPLHSAVATESFIQPTETLQWDPDRTYTGYTAFIGNNGNCYLIDMERYVVKSIPGFENYPTVGYWSLMENGNLRRMITPVNNPIMGYGPGPGGGSGY